MKYKMVIFDWDGTLMDSIPKIVTAMQTAAAVVKVPIPTEQQVKDVIGLSLTPAIQGLFPDISDSDKASILSAYRDAFLGLEEVKSPFFPGAESLIHQLYEQKVILCVATGKSRKGLERVWQSLAPMFASSICAGEADSKPAPDMIHQLMTWHDCQSETVIMIGDSVHDMRMAESAGVARAAVTHGAHDAAQLSQYDPISVHDDLYSLQDWLMNERI